MSTYVFTGLVNGAIYALLIALGILLMYQTTGVLNFAFGAFGMVAAYFFWELATGSGMSPLLAFVLVLILAVVGGAGVGFITLPARESSEVTKAAATLGLLTALQALVLLAWGTDPKSTTSLIDKVAFHAFDIAITWQRVLALVVAIGGSAAILAFLRMGKLGAALRAAREQHGDLPPHRAPGAAPMGHCVVDLDLRRVTRRAAHPARHRHVAREPQLHRAHAARRSARGPVPLHPDRPRERARARRRAGRVPGQRHARSLP